jgi:hypothetical protein
MKNAVDIYKTEIQNFIFEVRNKQVILDSDLAFFYGVETKRVNEQVKRNIQRFPENFCFRLNDQEFDALRSQSATFENILRSQSATSNTKGGRRYNPYAFTEQGVAMLSSVLNSEAAIKMSIRIIEAFVQMRHIIVSNSALFNKVSLLELKQFETDNKIQSIIDSLENKSLTQTEGIFYDGQIFDAWLLVSNIIKSAKKSIVLIDNYVDEATLSLLDKRKQGVDALIYTANLNKKTVTDIVKHNQQYPEIVVKLFKDSHDRFLIIDNNEIFHIGASLKDLGKKWFAFSKIYLGSDQPSNMLQKLENQNNTI